MGLYALPLFLGFTSNSFHALTHIWSKTPATQYIL